MTNLQLSTTPMLVAIVGAPGVGKSTLAAGLRETLNCPVFRLRETLRGPRFETSSPPRVDDLGWVDDQTVQSALRYEFIETNTFDGERIVVTDNFPGTGDQLELLALIATTTGRRLVIVEVTSDSADSRVLSRLVCRTCQDGHAPAPRGRPRPDRCPICNSLLVCRAEDEPDRHQRRTRRYREARPGLLATAQRLDLPIAHLSNNDHERDLVALLLQPEASTVAKGST